MLAVGPLGPQYCYLFAWYELGRQAQLVCVRPGLLYLQHRLLFCEKLISHGCQEGGQLCLVATEGQQTTK